jgi:hypothetical protein
VSHSSTFAAGPYRCLKPRETTVSHSSTFAAGPYRCFKACETTVRYSWIFGAGCYRCLGGAETAVCDSRGLQAEAEHGSGVLAGAAGGDVGVAASQGQAARVVQAGRDQPALVAGIDPEQGVAVHDIEASVR